MRPGKDTTEARHRALRELLAASRSGTQDALQKRLRARGFVVTQSSISRDLAALGAVKLDGRYVLRAALVEAPPREDELAIAASFIQGVSAAGPHLLVIRTPPGRAAVVSLAIDRADWREVVGTVAGDDTLLVTSSGRRGQARIQARLERLLKESRHG